MKFTIVIPAFFCVSLSLTSYAEEQEATQKAQELTKVQTNIQEINQNIAEIKLKRELLSSQLRTIEKQYGKLAGSVRDLRAQISEKQQRLEQIKTEIDQRLNEISQENGELGNQVRTAYLMGQQEKLRLLLNQQDPVRASRMMVYYDYLNKRRLKKLAMIKENLALLKQLEQAKQQERGLIEQATKLHQSEQIDLSKTKKEREELLAKLNTQFTSKSRELNELENDQKELQDLIVSLQRQAEIKKQAEQAQAKADAEKQLAEAQQQLEQQKQAAEEEKLASEQAAAEKYAAEQKRLAEEKLTAERLAAEEAKLKTEKEATEKAAAEKFAEQERLAAQKLAVAQQQVNATSDLDEDGNIIQASAEKAEPSTSVVNIDTSNKSFAASKGQLPWPIKGAILENFGSKRADTRADGVLIAAQEGADIRAVSDGKVVFADWLRGYGLLVILDHGGGYMTLYAFNQSLYTKVGDRVKAGTVIASVGKSGGRDTAGLYFGVRKQGKPVDPAQWCRKS